MRRKIINFSVLPSGAMRKYEHQPERSEPPPRWAVARLPGIADRSLPLPRALGAERWAW